MNKKILLVFSLFLFLLAFDSIGQFSRNLDIPGRLQWTNAHGYCGETSIQMIGLYYGNYISQELVRTVAGGELLVRANDKLALDKLAFTYDEWDINQTKPQYQNHLIWIKQHLYNYHPVIITVYVKGGSYPGYDHIIPAIGFSGSDVQTFQNSDQLSYHSCYSQSSFTRTFESIWDTRSMTGNGSQYRYCIPKDKNCGIAVTGIKDELDITKPVHLAINRWDEPNVTLGENPELLNGIITIDSLTIGESYVLLRYNHYSKVPSSSFIPSEADAAVYFIATESTKTLEDSFMSNAGVFYRCISSEFNAVNQNKVEQKIKIHPNPSTGIFNFYTGDQFSKDAKVEIKDYCGKLLLSKVLEDGIVDLKAYQKGIYVAKIMNGTEVVVAKLIVK